MLWHGNDVNLLLLEFPITGFAVNSQSIGHDITRGKSEETVERIHYVKMTPNSLC